MKYSKTVDKLSYQNSLNRLSFLSRGGFGFGFWEGVEKNLGRVVQRNLDVPKSG